jgi:tRNA(Ile)-lysidine synthase
MRGRAELEIADLDIAARAAGALGRRLSDETSIAIAVSGGADSAGLLLLAAAAWPGRVTALTVDHGLRDGSAAEAALVAAECARRGMPHRLLGWEGNKPAAGVQAAARAARYRLMTEWCAAAEVGVLMTAHHADDQAETLLMRLARGSGSGGLAGIRVRRQLAPGVVLLRPLLGVRRADLAAIAVAAGWPVTDDPSNANPRFLRTRARAALAAAPWLDVAQMAAAAANMADAEAALAWAADRAWAGRAVAGAGGVQIDAAGLPGELAQRLLRRAIAALAPGAQPRGPGLARLAAVLAAGGTGTLAGVRAAGGGAPGAVWRLAAAQPRRNRGATAAADQP